MRFPNGGSQTSFAKHILADESGVTHGKPPRIATRQIVELRTQFDTIPHYDHTRAVEPLERAATMGNG
jgi:hypothetical protein